MKNDDSGSPVFCVRTRMRIFLVLLVFGGLISGCQARSSVLEAPPELDPALIPEGMTAEEAATLASLEQVDDYPLYSMTYFGDYNPYEEETGINPAFQADWACSLFVAFGDSDEVLYGRNFDWDFSPGLLLYTDPEDGYASVSMIDLYYLGYGGEQAFGLTDLTLEALAGMLSAPYLPFDGLNEAGLAVGFAAVPDVGTKPDPAKETIDSLMVVRKILDGAATVEEAVEIIKSYNIDWGSGPALHYLVADNSGHSALIEFSSEGIVTLENQKPWQGATNFLLSQAWTDPATHCWRYGVISERLEENEGILSPQEAINLLEDVSQENTQWSVVYQMSAGEVWIAMGRDYADILKFDLK